MKKEIKNKYRLIKLKIRLIWDYLMIKVKVKLIIIYNIILLKMKINLFYLQKILEFLSVSIL